MKNDTNQNPAWLLILSFFPAKLAFSQVAERFNLTFMQLLTLCLVESYKEGPVMQGITATLGCDASNVTGFVDKLVHLGFLERSESPYDRRAKIIRLTYKGVQAQQEALHSFDKSDFMRILTDEERATLVQILQKLQPQK